jgi:hypothetical protein
MMKLLDQWRFTEGKPMKKKKASLQKKAADAIGGSIGMLILIGILGTPGALIGGAIILDLIIFAWLLAKAGFFEDPPKGFGSTVDPDSGQLWLVHSALIWYMAWHLFSSQEQTVRPTIFNLKSST